MMYDLDSLYKVTLGLDPLQKIVSIIGTTFTAVLAWKGYRFAVLTWGFDKMESNVEKFKKRISGNPVNPSYVGPIIGNLAEDEKGMKNYLRLYAIVLHEVSNEFQKIPQKIEEAEKIAVKIINERKASR